MCLIEIYIFFIYERPYFLILGGREIVLRGRGNCFVWLSWKIGTSALTDLHWLLPWEQVQAGPLCRPGQLWRWLPSVTVTEKESQRPLPWRAVAVDLCGMGSGEVTLFYLHPLESTGFSLLSWCRSRPAPCASGYNRASTEGRHVTRRWQFSVPASSSGGITIACAEGDVFASKVKCIHFRNQNK